MVHGNREFRPLAADRLFRTVKRVDFRAFETYFLITAGYLVMAIVLRFALNTAGKRLFARTARSAR